MKFLAFLTHFLLATVLTVTILLLVIEHTVSAAYVTSVADRTNAYQTLSEMLPEQLVNQSKDEGPGGDAHDQGDQQQMAAVLKSALTPDYLKRLLTNVTAQFEAMLKHGAPQAVIDLSEIRTQAQAAGADPGTEQFKPVVIPAEKLEKPIMIFGWLRMAEIGGLAASAVLLLLSLLVSYRRRSYRGLGIGLADVALSEAILVAALLVIPDRVLDKIHFNESVAPFAPLIQSVLIRLAHDWQVYFGAAGAVAALLAIGLFLFGRYLPMRRLPAAVAEPSVAANEPVTARHKA